jgi:hypothetical protein
MTLVTRSRGCSGDRLPRVGKDMTTALVLVAIPARRATPRGDEVLTETDPHADRDGPDQDVDHLQSQLPAPASVR